MPSPDFEIVLKGSTLPAIERNPALPYKHRAHDAATLQQLFDREFAETCNTRLQRSPDQDPVYLPADTRCPYHRILFAHGFFASALHEVSHWCIAGPARRLQPDFGYWYCPDGRNTIEQQDFERVEVKPQAIEWMFAQACDYPFQVSVDNLSGRSGDPAAFKRAIHDQVLWYCRHGLPARAEQFRRALAGYYATNDSDDGQRYQLEAL